jgi:hypothetical protein
MENYYEKNLLINNREIKYKGIFDLNEIFSSINKILDEQGYQKREKKSEELVQESGRKFYFELRPYNEVSNYVTLLIKIKISVDNMTDKVVDNKKYNNADLLIAFDAWYLSDSQGKWRLKPWVFFLKGIINKYFYQFPLEAGFQGKLVKDTAQIYNGLKSLLKSYQPERKENMAEKDVIKEINKDIRNKKNSDGSNEHFKKLTN